MPVFVFGTNPSLGSMHKPMQTQVNTSTCLQTELHLTIPPGILQFEQLNPRVISLWFMVISHYLLNFMSIFFSVMLDVLTMDKWFPKVIC